MKKQKNWVTGHFRATNGNILYYRWVHA